MSPLRVMSFNIHGAPRNADGPHAWERRAAVNAATIEACAPDLIGFQELRGANLRTYRESLPGYGCLLGPRAGNRAPHEFNTIFFDPGRLQVLGCGGFWISATPDRYSTAWRSRVIRSANWARLRCRETGTAFLHLNTHLDHISGIARLRGSELIVGRATALRKDGDGDLPVLLTGDFNSSPKSPPYRVFARAGFVDTYLAAGNEDAPDANTFHGFFRGWPDLALRYAHWVLYDLVPKRIDWVLLLDPERRIEVRSGAIVRHHDEESGVFPSDHYPVLAELESTAPGGWG